MIGIRDTFTLATTKLRTRKIRLGLTIAISGILFGALVAGSLGSNGVFSSVDSFTKEGLGSRYIVSGHTQASTVYNNAEIIDRASALYSQVVAAKKAEAKKLSIEYDAATEPKPTVEVDTPKGKQSYLDPTNPLTKQAAKEYFVTHPAIGLADFKAEAQKYGAKQYYQSTWASIPNGDRLEVLKDGQEDYQDEMQPGKEKYDPNGVSSFTSQWSAMSDDLLRTFILPGENLSSGSDGSIPIIVPYSVAQTFLKLDALPGSAPADQRLERLKYVRNNLKNTTYEACYRNQTSASFVEEAKMTQRQIESNKNNKEYKKPSLIYGLPTQACGVAPVIRDVRTVDEKKAAAKQLQFDQKFGKPEPAQTILKFRVVGISPDVNTTNFSRIDQIFSSIVQSSLGNGWFTPASQLEASPLLSTFFTDDGLGFNQPANYLAEFHTPQQEQAYIDKKSCNGYDFDKCRQAGTPFAISPYGSNSIAVASIKNKADKIRTLAAIGVIILAAVIMMGTVGRMIADSRRETAIFRAIGAKRLDISAIYVLYTVLLSLMVAAFALIVGFAIASYVNDKYSAELTAQALVAYNAQDMSRMFKLFGINATDLLGIVGSVVLAGIISAIIPLLRNVRRNPIRDMRDEN